jgi:hypothetical protein
VPRRHGVSSGAVSSSGPAPTTEDRHESADAAVRPAWRAHDVATLAAAAVFGARFVVTQRLYGIDSTGGLAIAKVVMGTPMTLVAAVVAFWAFRRSTRRLIPPTSRAREGRLSPG